MKYKYWKNLNLNNYYAYLNSIIESRGQWNIEDDQIYENHHIILRSYKGLPEKIRHNTKHENLIWLTPYEHYKAHEILALDNLDCPKVVFAWQFMSTKTDGSKISSPEEYQILKEAFSKVNSEINTGKPSKMKGEHFPEGFGEKVSQKTKEALADPEVKKKMSKARKGRKPWNFGVPIEEDQKIKLSKIKLGKPLSEEHKKNIGLAKLNHPVTEETKKKISDAQSGINSKHNKAIICVETGEIFFNIKSAAEKMNLNAGNICQCCKHNRGPVGGYHWEYINQEDNLIIK